MHLICRNFAVLFRFVYTKSFLSNPIIFNLTAKNQNIARGLQKKLIKKIKKKLQ